MIIDPPSVFSPLEEWTAFRIEMERAVKAFPESDLAREYLAIAKDQEALLSAN